MAYHENIASMLKESLPEMLEAAKLCIDYRKTDWWCLGYPAAVLLFSIIDSIGSYFRKNDGFQIQIYGKKRSIQETEDHFRILNSKYFNQKLSDTNIKTLYDNFRSKLVHNSRLGKNAVLIKNNSVFDNYVWWWVTSKVIPKIDNSMDKAFLEEKDGTIVVNITALYRLCEQAVEMLLNDEDYEKIISNSKLWKTW